MTTTQTEDSRTSPGENAASLIRGYVERFRAAGKKTVTELLKTAAVIAEAHQELGEQQLTKFYSQIGLNREGSTSRKMRKVGETRLRFENHTDILPNNWTTLWQLTKLSDREYQRLVDNNVLTPFVTWPTIRAHLASSGGPERPKPQRVVIDLNKVQMTGRSAFAKKLKSLLKEFDVLSVEKQSSTLDQFIEPETPGGSNA